PYPLSLHDALPIYAVHAVRDPSGNTVGDPLGQPRLADSSGTDQRDEPETVQQHAARGHLGLAADEAGGLRVTEALRDAARGAPRLRGARHLSTYAFPAVLPSARVPTAGADVGTEDVPGGQPAPGSGLRQGAGREVGRLGHLGV